MDTKIEWAHYTFSPWIGCAKVSPGCENCYAEARDKRHLLERVDHWGPRAPRYRVSEGAWKKPLKWNREAKRDGTRYRVFPSMMDWAEIHAEPAVNEMLNAQRWRLWQLIMDTPYLDWLLLSKRPQNWKRVLPPIWRDGMQGNVWLGISAEDQRRFDERYAYMDAVRAPVHFVSYEPALGPLSIGGRFRPLSGGRGRGVNWVIAGAESGPRARPMDEAWVRELRLECAGAGVPLFYKQRREGRKIVSLPILDGRRNAELPLAGVL